jgi:hypothetical protein
MTTTKTTAIITALLMAMAMAMGSIVGAVSTTRNTATPITQLVVHLVVVIMLLIERCSKGPLRLRLRSSQRLISYSRIATAIEKVRSVSLITGSYFDKYYFFLVSCVLYPSYFILFIIYYNIPIIRLLYAYYTYTHFRSLHLYVIYTPFI